MADSDEKGEPIVWPFDRLTVSERNRKESRPYPTCCISKTWTDIKKTSRFLLKFHQVKRHQRSPDVRQKSVSTPVLDLFNGNFLDQLLMNRTIMTWVRNEINKRFLYRSHHLVPIYGSTNHNYRHLRER
jgi:hypothetical protein